MYKMNNMFLGNHALFLEIKEEYTNHLIDIIFPYVFEGIESLYIDACKYSTEKNQKDKLLIIFQQFLKNVENWSSTIIQKAVDRIKTNSNSTDYFDNLVKAVIKSNIILLSLGGTNIIPSDYESVDINQFVHRCYIECAKEAYNYTFLFYRDISNIEIKRNQLIIDDKFKNAIKYAIRKMTPIKKVLTDFLNNNFNEPELIENKPVNIFNGKTEVIEKPESIQNQESIKKIGGTEGNQLKFGSGTKENLIKNVEIIKDREIGIRQSEKLSEKNKIKNLVNSEMDNSKSETFNAFFMGHNTETKTKQKIIETYGSGDKRIENTEKSDMTERSERTEKNKSKKT